MTITFLGHAGLNIAIGDHNIVVDPFITGNEKAKGKVALAHIRPDFILLTHAHQDHILDVDALAEAHDPIIVSNYEIASHYGNKGFKMHPLNHGGQWQFPFGTVKYTQAIHTSSFPDGSYGGQPGGFILRAGDKTIYIAGDTALTYDMKLIAATEELDLAILPIGDNFTMGVDDAVIAADFLECDNIMGYHYDTFGYIEIDHDAARQKFSAGGKKLHLLDIGETLPV